MKQLFILLLMVVASCATTQAQTCGAKTKAGTACMRKVDKPGLHCWQHGGTTKTASTTTNTTSAIKPTCGATTKAGGKCKNRVKKTGDRCHLHKA